MARHLTLRDIGRGASRHRGRHSKWVLPAIVVCAALLAGVLPVRFADVISEGGGRSCRMPAIDLVVASSVDKSALLTTLAADFATRGGNVEGRCVHVTVVAKSSGAAESALAAGWRSADGPRPDVWSPSGSVWLPLLEDRMAETHRPSLIAAPASAPSIAASPMVVAMPRPMARALGWPGRPIGWSDLLHLASSRTGWATYGHPEWGHFSLGKTNPNFSHAGLEGTIAAYYAAVGRTSGLTMEDIEGADTRRFVAGVEQAVVRYGDNTASFLSDWQRADDSGRALTYISAVVTEENLVPAYNEGNPTADPALAGKHAPPNVPLVAIYPKEGTFIADHPYAVLKAPWVDAPKRAAAAAFLAYLRSPPVQRIWQDHHFRDAYDRLGPGATIAEGVIPSQPSRVFQPPSAKITNAILSSWSQLRKTANVLCLVDVSGSMGGKLPGSAQTKLDAAEQAAVASLKLFTDRDEVGLWSFAGGVRGKQDYHPLVSIGPMSAAFGGHPRREALDSALRSLHAGGNTGLYNTLGAAYATVRSRYQADRINAVVVLTDGRNDAQGGLDMAGLLALIRHDAGGHVIPVITIAYGPDADQATLSQISHATKGASYVATTPAEIPKVYSAALSNL